MLFFFHSYFVLLSCLIVTSFLNEIFLFKDYDPELFGKALPCLIAIGCALPPDYSLSKNFDDELYGAKNTGPSDGPYNPQPINTDA